MLDVGELFSFRLAARCHLDIRRLQVAMNDPSLVGGLDGVSELPQQLGRFTGFERGLA